MIGFVCCAHSVNHVWTLVRKQISDYLGQFNLRKKRLTEVPISEGL